MISPARLRLIQSTFLSLAFLPVALAQGPLAPPGPPAPTMKSLNQIDARVATAGERIPVNATTCPGDGSAVYVIAQSGSYFFTGDIVGLSGKDGIHITAPGVTLDLNGYQLDGASAPVKTGILIDQDNVTVRNGRVSNWGNRGIDVEGSGSTAFERVMVANCGTGYFIFGVARYDSCSAIGNQGNGFDGWLGHQYRGCFAADNLGNGYTFYDGNTAESCVSMHDAVGFALFGPGTVVRGCVASRYQSYGFLVLAQSAGLVECTATSDSPGGTGFLINDPNKGIPSGAVLDQCTTAYYPGIGGSIGIDAGAATGVTITSCTATGYAVTGISVGPGGTVSGCNTSGNGDRGIRFFFGAAITGNVVANNAVDGIAGDGVQCRIDGNTVTRHSGTGILATDSAETNFIVRNISRNPGVNYNPATGVNVGPTGQMPSNTLPSASPWANF